MSRGLMYAIKNPRSLFWHICQSGVFNWMPDKMYLKFVFPIMMGRRLNLNNPKTFSEKLQWLKLNDRQPSFVKLVDKYEVKKIVKDLIGEKYIIPTLGIWSSVEKIDFSSLPDKFAIKTTHDSGGVVICTNKSDLDIKRTKLILNQSLKHNFYYIGREWPYKNVPKRIIAEKLIEDTNGLVEYKIFCFDGVPKLFLVCSGKAHSEKRYNDYLDVDFNRIPVKSMNPVSKQNISKPKQYDELMDVAKKLSRGIPQVRVDLYIENEKVYFGELTLYHNSGLCRFDPDVWDNKFGSWIQLPSKEKE